MMGATFSMRGREISSPTGESISHLAEIEYSGGDSIRGRFRFGSPSAEVVQNSRK